MMNAEQALEHLREGNLRYTLGLCRRDTSLSHLHRAETVKEQIPFAIILGCSDSRVPVEIVFDQGLGDLFVIRVAGNVVAPSQVASAEFAAVQFGTRLIVVLGHSRCAAVLATLEELRQPKGIGKRSPHSIIDRVRPSVEPLLKTGLKHDFDALVQRAVRANIDASVSQLRHGSSLLGQLIQNEGLLVIGAEYSIETGQVELFDDASGVGPPRVHSQSM
ncbi:MAG: carbonic anhydrase [Gammaproteobacteria bacterium]|nr:MAG: carbonic anhydrase [Gammaproteobacteria bacterium]